MFGRARYRTYPKAQTVVKNPVNYLVVFPFARSINVLTFIKPLFVTFFLWNVKKIYFYKD